MRAKYGEPLEWLRLHSSYPGDDCLIWPYGRTPKGYGSVRWNGRTIHAHRAMCIMAHGEPASGYTEAAHSCGNAGCCNPQHLRHSTSAANHRDKAAHGTILCGEAHPRAKLKDADIIEIRRLLARGEKTQAELARSFGVTDGAISLAVKRTNWSCLA